MTRHERQRPSSGTRASIASAAARPMAEDGITDYHHAQKKAARQLGLPEHAAFPDSAKEVEIFLLNRGIDVTHAEPRNERVEAVLQMETDTADANLIILAPHLERISLKHRDGRPQERIRADALRALLKE